VSELLLPLRVPPRERSEASGEPQCANRRFRGILRRDKSGLGRACAFRRDGPASLDLGPRAHRRDRLGGRIFHQEGNVGVELRQTRLPGSRRRWIGYPGRRERRWRVRARRDRRCRLGSRRTRRVAGTRSFPRGVTERTLEGFPQAGFPWRGVLGRVGVEGVRQAEAPVRSHLPIVRSLSSTGNDH
jgi:hypothetical protein